MQKFKTFEEAVEAAREAGESIECEIRGHVYRVHPYGGRDYRAEQFVNHNGLENMYSHTKEEFMAHLKALFKRRNDVGNPVLAFADQMAVLLYAFGKGIAGMDEKDRALKLVKMIDAAEAGEDDDKEDRFPVCPKCGSDDLDVHMIGSARCQSCGLELTEKPLQDNHEPIYRCPKCKHEGIFVADLTCAGTVNGKGEVRSNDGDFDINSGGILRCQACGFDASPDDFEVTEEDNEPD
jgi:predicted Zn-ribbon and HTH transcriptional regulator